MANTVEEREAQIKAAEQQVEEQVEEAGKQAKQEAEQKGLSQEEVEEIVKTARKQEKDKLYGEIDDLKDRVKELQEHFRAEREEKESIKAEAEADKEKKRFEKLSEQQKQTEILERLEEKLNEERRARSALEDSLAQKEREAQLRVYREHAIRAAGEDTLIKELVYGNSEEEIDKAVETAKARFTEIEEKLKQEHGQRVKGAMSSTSPGTEAFEEQELEERLPNVDTDKYMQDPKYREDIQNKLASEYARAAGR